MTEQNGNGKLVNAIAPCHPELPAHYYEVVLSGIAHEIVANELANTLRRSLPPGMSVHVERVWSEDKT